MLVVFVLFYMLDAKIKFRQFLRSSPVFFDDLHKVFWFFTTFGAMGNKEHTTWLIKRILKFLCSLFANRQQKIIMEGLETEKNHQLVLKFLRNLLYLQP